MSLSIQTPESAEETLAAAPSNGTAMAVRGGPALGPEAFADLQEAFRAFNDASERFGEQYARLEARIAELNLELEAANTQLRCNLEEKQRMQEYLSMLLDSLPIGVVGADRRGKVCSLNSHAGAILDCDPSQAFGRPLLELLGASETACVQENGAKELLRAIRSNRPPDGTLEAELPRVRDNRKRALRLRLVPTGRQTGFSDEGEKIGEAAVVLLAEDVTEVRRLEHQASRNNRLAAMGEIAINVAHEIRNPLGSIELFASMLQRELAGDPVNGQVAGHITTGVRCLDHIVSNILQFARPRRLSLSAVDLNDLLDKTLLFAEHALRQKEIHVERDYPRDADAEVGADAELLKQLFLNLFLNAVQATPEGGAVGVRTIPGAQSVEVQVWDSGPGFAPGVAAKVFDPFFTTRRKGTGLGLTIAHNIVASHHGGIDAENRPEGGALFTIVLPRKPPESAEPEMPL